MRLPNIYFKGYIRITQETNMATAWYKQVNPPQRKALFSAWLGYVFDGFDFMMIFYILHIIKADLEIGRAHV